MLIIESKQAGFRRCGIAHPVEATAYPDDHFSEEELALLEAEPMLRVAHGEDDDLTGTGDEITEESVTAAISQLDLMNATLWTGDGKPRTEALEAILKGKVTAKERDAAWERHQKEKV